MIIMIDGTIVLLNRSGVTRFFPCPSWISVMFVIKLSYGAFPFRSSLPIF